MSAVPTEILAEHPRLYRILLRVLPWALTVAVAAFIAGSWFLVSVVSSNRDTADQLARQNAYQQATIRLLCDDLYILDGLVQASIVAVEIQYQDDRKTRPRTAAADVAFVRDFRNYHDQLADQLTRRTSPCVRS